MFVPILGPLFAYEAFMIIAQYESCRGRVLRHYLNRSTSFNLAHDTSLAVAVGVNLGVEFLAKGRLVSGASSTGGAGSGAGRADTVGSGGGGSASRASNSTGLASETVVAGLTTSKGAAL